MRLAEEAASRWETDPSPAVEQQRSTEIKRCLKSLDARGRLYVSGPTFAMVLTRAPIAPKAKEVVSKSVRDENLYHKEPKLRPTWSVWIPINVGFPFVKLMILCFREKLDDEVLVGAL